MGGVVPNQFFLCTKPSTVNKKSLTVSSGSKELLEFPVQKADYILKYKLVT